MARNKENKLEQLSMFDIHLPPNGEKEVREIISKEPVEVIPQPEVKNQEIVNLARVPDSEFRATEHKPPTVADIIKTIEKGAYKIGTHELLSDVFQCGAIAVSNQFDFRRAPQREKTYKQIMGKHDKNGQMLILEIFSMIYSLLSQQIFTNVGFNDYLGELHMKSNTSNSKAGQFFTPYHVSKLCAGISVDPNIVNECGDADKILTLNEPACGSGGMVLAAADIMYNRHHLNISRNLLVVCSDIDTRCVHMAYLQLGLAGIPAIVCHQDTLSLKTWDVWETPACIMQRNRFRNFIKAKEKVK